MKSEHACANEVYLGGSKYLLHCAMSDLQVARENTSPYVGAKANRTVTSGLGERGIKVSYYSTDSHSLAS